MQGCRRTRTTDTKKRRTKRRFLNTRWRLADPISRLQSLLPVGAAGGSRSGEEQTRQTQSGIAGASPITYPELEGIELKSHTPSDSAQTAEGVSESAVEPPIVDSSHINRDSTWPPLRTLPKPNHHPTQGLPLELLSAVSPDEHEVSQYETCQQRRRTYSPLEISTWSRSQEPRQNRRRRSYYLESPPRLSQPVEADNLGRLAHPPFGIENIFPLSQSPK